MMDAHPELQPLQPELVKSISEDDDDNQSREEEEPFVDHSALAYLLRYETMIRQQEAENMASLAHVRPILDRIEELGSSTEGRRDPPSAIDEDTVMQREVSFRVLRKALENLESDSLSSEPMTTDRQFMLVLRTLTANISNNEESSNQTITWAELHQCYRSVVTGMQTLQHLPPSSHARVRARDRSLSVLSLFQPPSTKLLGQDALHSDNNKALMDDMSSAPTKSRGGGMFWFLIAASFYLVAIGMAARHSPLANNISIPSLPSGIDHEVFLSLWTENVGSLSSNTSSSSSTKVVKKSSSTATANKGDRTASSLAVRVSGVAVAPLVVKGFILLPSPLQGLGVLTLGALSLTASVSQMIYRFVDHHREQDTENSHG